MSVEARPEVEALKEANASLEILRVAAEGWPIPNVYTRALDALAEALTTLAADARVRERLETAVRHVVNDSPGTPESVKQYLRAALTGLGEGVAAEPDDDSLTPEQPERPEPTYCHACIFAEGKHDPDCPEQPERSPEGGTCSRCGGSGDDKPASDPTALTREPCRQCGGTGRSPEGGSE